jgi:hypothetical protein
MLDLRDVVGDGLWRAPGVDARADGLSLHDVSL